MPCRLPLLAAGLLALSSFGLLACGGEDAKLLPGETAREITANLDTVQQLATEGDCLGAESAARQVGEQIEALRGVDRKLKQALEEGAVRLEEVIATCEEEESPAPTAAEGEVASPDSAKEAERREKEVEKSEKEAEKQEKEQQKEEEAEPEGTQSLPPPANGEGKSLENGHGPPVEEGPEEVPGEGASGGVSPAAPAGGDE